MRGLGRAGVVGAVALSMMVGAPGASAQEPSARKSDNITFKTFLAEPDVVSAHFKGNLMFVSTLKGLSVYNVANAEAPAKLGFLPLPHFENEDVDMSIASDFVLISNDPSEGQGILYVIDVSNPALPTIKGQMDTGSPDLGFDFAPGILSYGTGHTASCVPGPLLTDDDCKYAYLAGTRFGIDIVDLSSPDNPTYADRDPVAPGIQKNFPAEEASGGLATHDVQFDAAGHALITGGGGTAIYDIGDPLNPALVSDTDEEGESDYVEDTLDDGNNGGDSLNDFIHHNSHRMPNRSLESYDPAAPGAPAADADSDVMVITEEDYSRPTCEGAGSTQTWQINGDTITNLDDWKVEVDPSKLALCSAHYFDEDAGLVVQGYYEQGTRFLDVSTPTDIRQVGFWIPNSNVTWGAVFAPTDPDRETVYALDHVRGIDVLHVERGGAGTVTAPPDDSGEQPPDICERRPPTNGDECPSNGPPAEGQPGQGSQNGSQDQGGSQDQSGAAGAEQGAKRSGRPKLRLTVRGRKRARPGKRLRYRFKVRNVGDAAARGVRLRIRLSRHLRYVRGGRHKRGSRIVLVRLGGVGAGRRKTRAIVTRVKRSGRGRRIVVRASVSRRRSAAAASSLAARTAAMPTVRAPVLDTWSQPRRFVTAYGVCRVYIED